MSEERYGYVRVRIDTSLDDDGWCFCTPPNHPEDLKKGLKHNPWNDSCQFYGQVIAIEDIGEDSVLDFIESMVADDEPREMTGLGEDAIKEIFNKLEDPLKKFAPITYNQIQDILARLEKLEKAKDVEMNDKWAEGRWYKPGELEFFIARENTGKSMLHTQYPDDGGLTDQKRDISEALSAREVLYNACLKAIHEIGLDQFKKISWFGSNVK